jgi:plastocyanin
MRALRVLLGLMLVALIGGSVSAEVVVISVDSTSLRFTPSEVTITEGDAVRFFWSGQALAHNAVADDGSFTTGEPERAVDHTVEFPVGTNGTYDFVCEPHESVGMVGTITVEPAPPVEEEEALPEDPVETPLNAGASMILGLLLACAVVAQREP